MSKILGDLSSLTAFLASTRARCRSLKVSSEAVTRIQAKSFKARARDCELKARARDLTLYLIRLLETESEDDSPSANWRWLAINIGSLLALSNMGSSQYLLTFLQESETTGARQKLTEVGFEKLRVHLKIHLMSDVGLLLIYSTLDRRIRGKELAFEGIRLIREVSSDDR